MNASVDTDGTTGIKGDVVIHKVNLNYTFQESLEYCAQFGLQLPTKNLSVFKLHEPDSGYDFNNFYFGFTRVGNHRNEYRNIYTGEIIDPD